MKHATEHVCEWGKWHPWCATYRCVHPGCYKNMPSDEVERRLNATERFVTFMEEYYSIRGKIESLRSDTEEDRILKAIYANILEGKDD